MELLQQNYKDALDQLINAIQESEILAAYLEEEDEVLYKNLQDEFEPAIHSVYEVVASESPLQLENLEKALLDPGFEGLYLPKILGYAVLRGHVDHNIKYAVPQNHFKDILLAICHSPNFEQIKKRIGQTTTIGFALSSDIWITNLIESIENKKIKAYLTTMKADALRDPEKRKDAYQKYRNQFSYVNFYSAEFPENGIQLISSYHALKSFLIYRAGHADSNESLMPHIKSFITNPSLRGSNEYLDLLIIIGLMFPLEGTMAQDYAHTFNEVYNGNEEVISAFFSLYDSLLNDDSMHIMPENEIQLSKLLSGITSSNLKAYFNTVLEVHAKGFVHPEQGASITFYIPMPKSWRKFKREAMNWMLHQSKPDLDNLLKAYFDSLLSEDKYISHYEAKKVWVDFPIGWIEICTKEPEYPTREVPLSVKDLIN